MPKIKIVEFTNSVDPDEVAYATCSGSTLFALWSLNSQYDIARKIYLVEILQI